MMEINSTLIVQMGNFFLAYVMLRSWLFGPAMRLIQEESIKHKTLVDQIEARKIVIAQKEYEKKARWQTYQQDFHAIMPTVPDLQQDLFEKTALVYTPKIISSAEVAHISADVLKALKQKVEHGS